MAVCCGACLKVPGTSGLGVLRMAPLLTERGRQDSVRQQAALAKEHCMDCRSSVSVKVAELPWLALRVGGLEVVQQLLVIQIPQPC